jgi:CP family cyanate transporter-like MFS transporter
MTDSRRPWLLAAILLVALNLRPGVTSIGPLLETIRSELSLGHSAASLLTGIPVLCMGLFPVFAVPFARRVGHSRGLFWMLLLAAAAILARAIGQGGALMFATAVAMGIGIAVAQAIVPATVKQHFSDRAASVMSLYSMFTTAGAGLGAVFTVPLQNLLGSWPLALAFWAAPAAVAAALWLPFAGAERAGMSVDVRAAAPALPWRSGLAWRITLFSGGAFGLFWAVQTWLAPHFEEEGWTAARAGLLLGVMTASQIAIQLTLAAVADRWRDRRPIMMAGLTAAVVGLVAVALAPRAAPWLWAVLLGLGVGTVFPLALTLPIDYARDPQTASRWTAMSLSGGYLIAAAAPVLLGMLRGLTGSFILPFLALAAMGAAIAALVLGFKPVRSGPKS